MADPFAGLFGLSKSTEAREESNNSDVFSLSDNSTSPFKFDGLEPLATDNTPNTEKNMNPSLDQDPFAILSPSLNSSTSECYNSPSNISSFTPSSDIPVDFNFSVSSPIEEPKRLVNKVNADADPFSIFSSSSGIPTPKKSGNNDDLINVGMSPRTNDEVKEISIPPIGNFGSENKQIDNIPTTEENLELGINVGSNWNEDDEGEEDLFEQAFDLTHSLEEILKNNDVFELCSKEMNQLRSVLQQIESQVQEREEDSKKLLEAFKSAKSKPTAPLPTDATKNRIQDSNIKKLQEIENRKFSNEEINHIVKMQRLWRSRRGSLNTGKFSDVVLYIKSHPTDDAKRHSEWHKTLRKIIHTEQNYVRKLYLLIHCYLNPLEEKLQKAEVAQKRSQEGASKFTSGIVNLGNNLTTSGECREVTQNQFEQIFMNIKVIFSFNQVLLKNLKQCYYFWPKKSISLSTIFQKMVPYFKVYCNYITQYQNHLKTLIELKKTNKSFNSWLQNVKRANLELKQKRIHDITDLSISPVNRIPEYVDLLTQFLMFSPSQDPDRVPLNSIIDELNKLTQYVSESSKINKNLRVIFKIQNLIGGNNVPNLLESNRAFIKDGAILILTDRIHRRHLFLFNDLIILTKKNWKLGLNDEQAFDLLIPLCDAVVKDDIEVPYSFRICYSRNEFMTFVAESDEEKAKWMRDIINACANSVSHLDPSQVDNSRSETSKPQKLLSKQGYLSKMEGGFIKTWKTRWIQIAAGILYSFESDKSSVPLRSYNLKEYIIKQLYVTDNFTRFCIHLIQLNGNRQIILSTHSKSTLEEWIIIIKKSVDLENSLVFEKSSNEQTKEQQKEEEPPTIVSSSEENSQSYNRQYEFTPGERFFPHDVSDEFIATVNERNMVRLFLDSSDENAKLQLDPSISKKSSPLPPLSSSDSSILPTQSFPEFKQSMAPPSPFDIPTKPTSKSDIIDFSSLRHHQEQSNTAKFDPSTSQQLPAAVIAFQTKFKLPATERPTQCKYKFIIINTLKLIIELFYRFCISFRMLYLSY